VQGGRSDGVRRSMPRLVAAVILAVGWPALSQPGPPARHSKDKKTRSMLDSSVAEFIKAVPELKGLAPATGQERLSILLQRTGENVKAFFDNLPDTTAHERIELERDFLDHRKEEFNYLALPRPGKNVAIDEYRTNAAGKRVEPQPLGQGFVTRGFVSTIVHFHPLYLPDSLFRYLGTENLGGHAMDVVYFEQIPGKARVKQSFKTANRSLEITIQGLAWIDSVSYHIARMRTELLEPYPVRELSEETAVSRYAEVRFSDMTQTFWLPEEVTVTFNWEGTVFRNRHRYSDFHLFRVAASEAPR
jgi:hypothetical protein